MELGIFILPTRETLDVVAIAKKVEALGFESLWVPDHPVIPKEITSKPPGGGELADYYRRLMEPFMALAAAAGATERIGLGTGVLVVPERNPLLLAKQVATLDLLSRGRVHLGIGCGWIKEEMEVMGADFANRWAQTREHVQAMQALWAPGTTAFSGTYTNFPEVYCEPKPVQQPHPPILIAGELEQAVERIAAYGDGWMPRYLWCKQADIEQGRKRLETLYAEAGRDISRLDISLFGGHPTREFHRSFADAGANRVIHFLPMEPEAQTLQRLEDIAATLP
jgi:probable F420-dependent oxidoreductase